MKTLAAAAFAALLSVSPALADWPLEKMNKYIDETNWILDDKCSGTTVNAQARLILTNWHCVDGSLGRKNGKNRADGDLYVSQLKYKDYSVVREVRYAATLLVGDEGADLALIQIKDDEVKLTAQATFADKEPVRGSKVVLVGNPAMEDASVIYGNVSSTGRTLTIQDKTRVYFQVSGGVVGGASGGAVYDEDGKFVGVTAASYTPAPILGYAVPLDVVKTFLAKASVVIALNSK